MKQQEASELIRSRAKQFGFSRVRFANLQKNVGVGDYDRFLANGYHGQMSWMVRSRPPRADPYLLLPDAQAIVVLGVDYYHPRPPDPGGLTGMVSRYAWGRDYHNKIGKQLRKFRLELQREIPDFNAYYGVDSRPFIERAWAQHAGLGFIGKNCMVIVPGQSSFLFLAMMLINIPVHADKPILTDHCGRCVRCLVGCPTDAFVMSRRLDARRCISYLTIEKKGEIPPAMRTKVGRWFFGCDHCQEVCPHNHRPPQSVELDFAPRPQHAWIDLEWVLKTPDQILHDHFKGTPLRRSGPIRLKRNAAVVLGNIADSASRKALYHGMEHPHPVVSSHSQWAFERIG